MADFENGDIIRIGAVMRYDGSDDVVNVYHVELLDAGPVNWATMAPVLQAYLDGIMGTLDTELSTLMTAGELQIANVTQATVFGAIAWGDFAQGGAAGAQCAAGAACFGFARTRKPRVQIRKYYGIFPQASLVDGSWDAGVTDAVGDALDYHIDTKVMGGGITLKGVAYNRTLLTTEYGVTVAVRTEPRYQRRRRRGAGS